MLMRFFTKVNVFKSISHQANIGHPEAKITPPKTLLPEPESDETYHDPIVFERITGDNITKAANRTQCTAGPSGVDAYAWRRFIVSKRFCGPV